MKLPKTRTPKSRGGFFKALVLLSGGLDSLLAAKILLDQKIKVTGLIFKSYFFNAQNGKAAAKQLNIPYKIVDFSKKHLEIVKIPAHGRGKAANPCVDCHLLMLKCAKKILEKEDYDFVATGEVLGERPFSQNKRALELIANDSGLNNRLVRPLSAKLLPSTLPEKKGWIDRNKLLAIQGRQRQVQIKLAKKYQLNFPQPAGGCILCEPEFSQKLLSLFKKWPETNGDDIQLLFLGRHFWQQKNKIVLGRNEKENNGLVKLTKKGDLLIEPTNFPGPTALIRGPKITSQISQKAKFLILTYTKKQTTSPIFTEKLV